MGARIFFLLSLGLLGASVSHAQSVSSPDPADKATDMPLHLALQWQGQAAGYNVYFGRDAGKLEFRGSARVPNTYNNIYIPTLQPQTRYYWRVESTDKFGKALALGPLWSFATGSQATGRDDSHPAAIDPGTYLAKYSDRSPHSSTSVLDKPKTFFGMSIETVVGSSDNLVVTTTGAVYVVKRRGLGMWRRIDPASNTIRPRLVAVLEFDEDIGPIAVGTDAADSVVLRTSKVELKFQTDSFFFLKALAAISYRHLNLVACATWNKGTGPNRIWTDGYGGSLHADISGTATVQESTTNSTALALKSGDVTAHMAFPPRPFDFEALYGKNARPHAHFVYGVRAIDQLLRPDAVRPFIEDGFGLFVLFAQIYPNAESPEYDRQADRIFYRIDPKCAASLKRFVDTAHAQGFKVITYLSYPAGPRWNYPEGPRKKQHQDVSVTLQAMREFQKEHHFDGWYFDNANVGSLLADYQFIRQVRRDVGDDGVIYHHDSVDVWDKWLEYSGLRAIMVDAYVDYTLTGETGPPAQVDHPNEAYMRFFSSGYGLHQAFGSHKRVSLMNLAMSEGEKLRLMGQSLNGSERNRSKAWLEYFKPGFDYRKQQYLSGQFRADVDWPLDPKTSWYRTPQNVQVERGPSGCVRIRWETDLPADSEVSYTSTGVWWPHHYRRLPPGPDGRVRDDQMTTAHFLELKDLKPANYEFKISSSNQKQGVEEIVWGFVGGFGVAAGK